MLLTAAPVKTRPGRPGAPCPESATSRPSPSSSSRARATPTPAARDASRRSAGPNRGSSRGLQGDDGASLKLAEAGAGSTQGSADAGNPAMRGGAGGGGGRPKRTGRRRAARTGTAGTGESDPGSAEPWFEAGRAHRQLARQARWSAWRKQLPGRRRLADALEPGAAVDQEDILDPVPKLDACVQTQLLQLGGQVLGQLVERRLAVVVEEASRHKTDERIPELDAHRIGGLGE